MVLVGGHLEPQHLRCQQGIWGPKWQATLDQSVSPVSKGEILPHKEDEERSRKTFSTNLWAPHHTPIHTVIHTTYLYMRDRGTLCNKDVCLSFRTSILCVVRITDTSILQWKLLTFSLSFKLFITCIHCVCVHTHMHMYALLMHRDWRTTCRSRFTPFTM